MLISGGTGSAFSFEVECGMIFLAAFCFTVTPFEYEEHQNCLENIPDLDVGVDEDHLEDNDRIKVEVCDPI